MKPITAHNFAGLNNVSGGGLSKGLAVPSSITDAIPTLDGTLSSRGEVTPAMALTGCSNLWASPGTGIVYCVSDGAIHRIDLSNSTSEQLFAITNPLQKVYYVSHGGIDFMGNKHWMKIVENGAVREMGQSVTDLHAMRWIATDNGKVLYLKNPDGSESVIPHPGEFAHAPTPMDFLCAKHGRLWGAIGDKVFYSFAGLLEWFENQKNFFRQSSDVTMVAPVDGGVFVGTEELTLFYSGTDPEAMGMTTKAYRGVVRNSMVLAPKLSEMPDHSPLWMDSDGFIVAGMPDGTIVPLTKEKVKSVPVADSRTGVIKCDGVDTVLIKIKELF